MAKRAELRVDPWSANRVPSRGQRANGRSYWRAWTQHNGTTISRYRWGTAAEIRRWLQMLPVTTVKTKPAQAYTQIRSVGEMVQAWLAWVKLHRASRTHANRRSQAKRLKAHPLWNVPVGQLAVTHLETYAWARHNDGIAWSTIQQELAAVSGAHTWAQRRGHLTPRTLYMPELPRDETPRRPARTPTPGEVAAVVEWLEQQDTTWPAPALRLMWAFGCRPSALLELEWSAVDLVQRTATLRGKGKRRTVPIPVAAFEVLVQLQATPPRVDPRAGPRVPARVLGLAVTSSALGYHVDQACEALELPRFPLRGLRRAMDDRLMRQRVDAGVLKGVQGHSATVAVEHYRTPTLEEMAKAMGDGRLPRGEVVRLKTSEEA